MTRLASNEIFYSVLTIKENTSGNRSG